MSAKHICLLLSCLLLLLGCGKRPAYRFSELPEKPLAEIPRELRGLWITRFDWTHPNPDSLRERIVDILDQTAAANFNAVFFQVRGQAETLYPSPLEPWSKLLEARDPGFDPLALAIEEAHRRGLTFYAYVNLLPLWNEETPPADPGHLYFRRGPEATADSSWVCFEPDGKPMRLNEYYYLNPALPEVKGYLKKVIRHLVQHYEIDGIHFDRIRYPGAIYVHDPYSNRRFEEDSLRSPQSRGAWARQQLTDLVEEVVAEALLIKPYLHFSAATWGLYRTDDISGYEHFNSGYRRYYQDAIDWLDKGIMDFIVPMIYWDIPAPLPNFDDLWRDFQTRTPHHRYIFPGMIVRRGWMEKGETVSQVALVRQTGGLGHVMFSYRALREKGLAVIRNLLYTRKVDLPEHLKRVRPEQVVALRLDSLPESRTVTVTPFSRVKTADPLGWIGLILPRKPDILTIERDDGMISLETRRWYPPYKYVVRENGTVERERPWLEFRRMPGDTTTAAEFHLLCKTDYPARAFIEEDSARVYRTGIFFDQINLAEGVNRVRAAVMAPDSSRTFYERQFVFRQPSERSPFPLWIDSASVEPRVSQRLLPEDAITVRFRGSKGQRAAVLIQPGNLTLPCTRSDGSDYSVYQARLSLQQLTRAKPHRLTLLLESDLPERSGEKLRRPLTATVEVRELREFPLVRTTQSNSRLSYNLGEIRLGGPLIGEYGPGVIFKTSGEIGEHYRIRLNRNESGFISREAVEILPEDAVQPSYYLQSLQSRPAEDGDVVYIPYPEAVPYAVYPEPGQRRIRISLYGVKTSSTWVIHRDSLRMVDQVTWQQVTPETYQVIIQLKTAKIWGYECRPRGNSLVFRVKYPPRLAAADAEQPLRGLKVAIEAGHGGRNLGAVGLSGLLEKDVNLDVARKLAGLCRANGVEVLQVRDRDRYMSLSVKRDTVEASDAHLHVSIHANSGGTRNGYLGVGGASTYYHNPFWAEFAGRVYRRMLELELAEFGMVGSFNYRVTRMTSRPAILVEQAFLSHAEDEEKLAAEAFRQAMAEKIYQGIADYAAYLLGRAGE